MLQKDQKNGIDKTAPNTVKTSAKPAPQSQPAKVAESSKPRIEDRIQKVEELRSLTAKRARTIETLNSLRAFHFAADDTCALTIADTQGHKFQTGNSNLLGILKTYLETILNDKVSALDDEILAFII